MTADRILASIRDARTLVPHIAANASALQWDRVDDAVQRGLGCPVPHHLANDGPLLKYADGSDAVLLLDALLHQPRPHKRGRFTCDVYSDEACEQNIIWIPCGASVVQLTVRNFARDYLADTTTGLVWF